jgi:hypothetical protein
MEIDRIECPGTQGSGRATIISRVGRIVLNSCAASIAGMAHRKQEQIWPILFKTYRRQQATMYPDM